MSLLFADQLPNDNDPEALKALLEAQVKRWEHLGHPALLERFILRNGHTGKAQKRPKKWRKRPNKECFKNAAEFVIENADYVKGKHPYIYVEGYALKPRLGVLIHHAWAEDEHGNVIDLTWEDPETALYYGVSFSLDDLRDELLKNQVYGLLDLFAGGLNTELMFDTDPELRKIVQDVIDSRRENVKDRARRLMEEHANG